MTNRRVISGIRQIGREEWRYWLRSKTATALGVATLLLIATSLTTNYVRINSEREARLQLQAVAEETFRNQPARHPHRMIHYGHYVFRTPAPLAIADPGVDPYTGTVMFLEGHRQNTATFAPRYTQALSGPLATLSPAFTYQLLVPLLLIVIGFASLAREREARTDQLVYTMSVSPTALWLGKSVALAGLALVLSLPLAGIALLAWLGGESALMSFVFWLGYALYLLCWVLMITAGSVWQQSASSALLVLLASWLVLAVLLPRIASSTAETSAPLNTNIRNNLEIAQALRAAGDGHNTSDPAFAKLRAQLLSQYDVERIEELPLNYRGIVAEAAEEKQTAAMNRFASRRIDQELAQASAANRFNILSPYLALKSFSITIANTNLQQHHQFLRDAEALRFSFVQQLNRLHASELTYADDAKRSVDDQSEQRTRIDPHHWRVLDDFESQRANGAERLAAALPNLAILLLWIFTAALAGQRGAMRTAQQNNA